MTGEFSDTSSAKQQKDNLGWAPRRSTDPGWAHGTLVDENRQQVKCKYCHKTFSGGGISRLKQHLAGERGNVAPCEEVPEEVKVQIQQHLNFKASQKFKRQKGMESISNSCTPNFKGMEGGGDDNNAVPSQKPVSELTISKKRGKEIVEGASNQKEKHKKQSLAAATSVVGLPLQQNLASQKSISEADMAVARFIWQADLPFSATESCFFQQMADAIAAVGPGYKIPSGDSLRSKLLNKATQDARAYCEELKKNWEVTGCSVLVDRWMDKSGRTVINFCVYCPKGTMFLKSVDASDITNSTDALLDLFDSVVKEVGHNNIINFVTDNSASYKTAGELLMSKYRTFFCSTCEVQRIDMVLQIIGRMDEVNEVLAKAKRIIRFIYDDTQVLNLMRKKTGGRDIPKGAITKFASMFSTLENISSFKDHLQQMVTGEAWTLLSFSNRWARLEIENIILDSLFWSSCDQTLKVVKPLISVLHLLDSEEKPSMGYLYDAMEKAKERTIEAIYEMEFQWMPFLKVIDQIWQEEFHNPIHATAHYLNPSLFYNTSSSSNKVIPKCILDCVETLVPSVSDQDRIIIDIIAHHLGFIHGNRGAEAVKASCSNSGANIRDWMEDMGSTEAEDTDNSVDSTDHGSRNVTNNNATDNATSPISDF